jgi:hypothetical protein
MKNKIRRFSMKKINIVLLLLIIIAIILIVVKICNQDVVENIEIEGGISKENLEYEVEREILYGEKSNYSEFNSDNQRVNTSDEIKKSQNVEEGLEVTDFNITYQDGYTKILVNAKNTSSEEKGGYNVNLVFFNDQNEEVITLIAYVNKVQPNEETMICTSLTADIADVYRCEIQKVEENSNE